MSKFRRIESVKEQNFYKRNYVKATEIITPKFYLEEDKVVGGEELDVIDEIINTHINIANKYSSVILSGINGVSSISTSPICSGLNTISGLSKFFVKQNNLTDIDVNDLEKNILIKSGRSLTEFETSSQFRNYLVTNLLPSIILNKPTITLQGVHPSSMHEYLVTNLSWIYLLNVSGFSYDGSTIVADALVDTLWYGDKFQLNTGIKCLTEYVFRNFTASSASWFPLGVLPTSFLPNIVYDDPENTSGLQQLEKLKTLVDIIYSPNYFDRNDTKVKEAFNNFINTGDYLDTKESQGPFYKYLKAISYAFADYTNFSDTLELLNDVNKCPDEYLPYLADLLGWTLLGTEPLKWRLQLLNALSVYRSAGTKKALQFILDSTFSKDSLQVSSEIIEMWESYIPHLIYYALATESTLLKDFTTWTQAEANRFSINYIPSSLDQSIRCVVDEIIFRTSKLFNFRYWYNGKLLSITDSELLFNYRGRDFKVPPFEEYQYYLNQNINTNIVAYIVDQLECFGVPRPFAEQVGQYILDNSIYAGKDVSMGYSWLIFTSGVQYPPNWNSVILDISNKKSEFLPLWNGKSSHFKMFFETGRFDFTDDNLVVNSKQGLRVLADLVEKFSPAHSIPQIFLKASAVDDFTYGTTDLPYISLDKKDHAAIANSDSYGFKNYEISGYNMNLYKRGLGDGDYLTPPNYIWRDSVDSIIDSVLNSGSIAAPRKSFRRRNHKTTINDLGLYDRSGFNMPTTYKNYVTENSYSSLGFLPLGLIPSSQQYVPIPDYNNIPLIYNICESLNSKNIFSGLVISSTFPCRGERRLESNTKSPEYGSSVDYYIDRGQLDNILNVMFYISEHSKNVLASAIISNNVSSYVNQFIWKDVYGSLANELTEDDTKVYFNKNNFKFGKDIHKLYNDYCDYFNRYKLLRRYIHLDGPTIFGHIFGSIFKNSDFTLYGSSIATTPQIITSSLDTEFTLKPGSIWFPASGGGIYNSFLLQPSSFRITPSEVGNRTILDGVDLIHTIGAGSRNHFTLFDLGKQTFRVYSLNKSSFVVDNNILRISSKSNFGLPRLRYDVKSHVHKAEDGYPLSSNLLIPEHEFTLELATLLASDDFKKFGRGSLGVFIHTGYENSGTWIFTPNNAWEFTYVSSINNNSVKSTYAHKVDFGPRDGFDVSGEACLVDLKLNSMYNLSSINFDITKLRFNTKNKPIRVPEHYYKVYQQVHRPNQNYYVEVFLYPNQEQNLYIDYVSLMDSTLNKWSQFLVSAVGNPFPVGDFNCKEFRLKLEREHLYHIFKYFTEVTGDKTNFGKASRISAVTASTYGTKGGSRLNYVIDPDWTAGRTRLFSDNLLVQLYIEN